MLKNPAAIKANYADFRHIKTRQVLQIVLEVPAERAEEALQMLGFPVAGRERLVAVALLDLKSDDHKNDAEPERIPFAKLSPTKQAAIKCQDDDFVRFLGVTMDEAPAKVRELCRVSSRSELATNAIAAQRWRELLTEYETEWRFR